MWLSLRLDTGWVQDSILLLTLDSSSMCGLSLVKVPIRVPPSSLELMSGGHGRRHPLACVSHTSGTQSSLPPPLKAPCHILVSAPDQATPVWLIDFKTNALQANGSMSALISDWNCDVLSGLSETMPGKGDNPCTMGPLFSFQSLASCPSFSLATLCGRQGYRWHWKREHSKNTLRTKEFKRRYGWKTFCSIFKL